MKDFVNILSYLRKTKNLQITVKDLTGWLGKMPLSEMLKEFDSHDNSFCSYIKSNTAASTHCVEISHIDLYNKISNQENIAQPFWGVCYSGVREYVVPIVSANSVIAALIVGVFPCEPERIQSSFDRIQNKYDFDKSILSTLYMDCFMNRPPLEEGTISLLHLCAEHMGNYVSNHTDTKRQNFSGRHQAILSTATNYIRANRHSKILISDIAARCYCSESTLSHCFKDAMGMSIGKYILIKRIEKAKKLLNTSSLTVTEISEKCGFNTSEYFSYAFKQNTGMTANDYRRFNQLKSKEKM